MASPTLQLSNAMSFPKKEAVDTKVNDIDIIHWSDDRLLKEVSMKRFQHILSGRGLIARKVSSGKAGLAPMNMRYMKNHIYIYSFKGRLVIAIDDIKNCVACGKVLTIKTSDGIETSVMLRSMTNVLAIRNVIGKGGGLTHL